MWAANILMFISLLLSSSGQPQGQLAPMMAHQQAAAHTQRPFLSGANVCGRATNQPRCCEGWQQASASVRLCIRPICPLGCGIGVCTRPNTCRCPDGKLIPTCPTAVCRLPCLNGGTCIGPDHCACVRGFTGKQCQSDFRLGPCYVEVRDRRCHGNVPGLVCTKLLCCSTIGQAWGNPCERCPGKPELCERGYLQDIRSRSCRDIDECKAVPRLCTGGRCINTAGSFHCECGPGRTMHPRTQTCVDIDECDTIPNVCANGRCENTDGSFRCVCPPGFTLSPDQLYCVEAQTDDCFMKVVNGYCVEASQLNVTRAACCCSETGAAAWGQTCEPCPSDATSEKGQLCPNVTLPTPGTRGTGVCVSGRNVCEHGRCVSTEGGYRCDCSSGYGVSPDGRSCLDIDECLDVNACGHGKCQNRDGGFSCTCDEGFERTADGRNCTDINECQLGGICTHGACVNEQGGYRCDCDPGFDVSSDKRRCVDRDECSLEPADRCINGVCENTPGGYRCSCDEGFVASADQKLCEDKNECSLDPDVCMNGRCVNTAGDYRCACNRGYASSQDGKHCHDVKLGRCYTKVANSRCSEPTMKLVTVSQCCCGMENSSRRGFDDPCTPCPLPDAEEYKRICCHGPGMDCAGRDIDECANNDGMEKAMCTSGRCQNTARGYVCVCDPGFRSDSTRKSCKDIDECKENPNHCQVGVCQNLHGSYKCICPSGFTFDPRTKNCEDDDECTLSSSCIAGVCVNTLGSYRCRCPSGLTLDSTGRICQDTRTAPCWTKVVNNRCEASINGAVSKEICCQTGGVAWGSPCEQCSSVGRCPPGFAVQDQPRCTDIDECAIYPTLCLNGDCRNTNGSYSCVCPPGYTLDDRGRSCVDTRESVCYRSVSGSGCHEPFAGIVKKDLCCCSAGAGWGDPCEECPLMNTAAFTELCGGKDRGVTVVETVTGPRVADINECVLQDLCRNGVCVNAQGSFECNCNDGYVLNERGTDCNELDECQISPGLCGNGTCTNLPGSFRCDCFVGFEVNRMLGVCVDTDECERNPCADGTCVNTVGSYACVCPDGMALMKDGQTCEDKNECDSPGVCENGRCLNFQGGFQCDCAAGFESTANMKACIDIDECSVENGGCSESCNNTVGSFFCDCPAGFILQLDAKSCMDLDECMISPDICGPGNNCTNLEGGFRCSCSPGFKLSADGRSCMDMDECQEDPRLCTNGVCRNTPGSFECLCANGFVLTEGFNRACVDVNECEVGRSNCDENARCSNTIGGFACECKPGYRGSGENCTDVDECSEGLSSCSDRSTCVNSPGSYHCICRPGYSGNGSLCEDINECLEQPDLCEHGLCINRLGRFECECEIGYVPHKDHKSCLDINECEMFADLCHHGWCENLPGMFRCVCDKGFQLTSLGTNCTDVDECEVTGMCPNGHCVNQMGGYRCRCDKDFALNAKGTGCVDMRKLPCHRVLRNSTCLNPLAPLYRGTCCCTVGKAWGEQCTPCPEQGTAEYRRLCPGGPGFVPNVNTTVIIDVDECKEVVGICRTGRCLNTVGSFTCTCPHGFKHDVTTGNCIDVDECADIPFVCGLDGVCLNTNGSYNCVCPDGQTTEPDGRCKDYRKRPCYFDEDGECSAQFSVNVSRAECCCTVGTAYGGDACHKCPTAGSEEYTALCPRIVHPPTAPTLEKLSTTTQPAQLKGNTSVFPLTTSSTPTAGSGLSTTVQPEQDMDECEKFPELCLYGTCINTPGSFRCECPLGFTLNSRGIICQDVDECNMDPCKNGAICMNTFGSFICKCPEGYTQDVTGLRCVDRNECLDGGYCRHGGCKNSIGSFTCSCDMGYELSNNQTTCVDKDECTLDPDLCGNGTCANLPGSYECTCHKGFMLSMRGYCKDIDECLQDSICRHGICTNTEGAFVCDCSLGYKLDARNTSCEDVDECSEIEGYCRNGRCSNTIGSSICECLPGYELAAAGKECIDVDECDRDPAHCRPGGRCINTPGGFRCSCEAGYQTSTAGTLCIDTRRDFCFKKFDESGCTAAVPGEVTKCDCCCTAHAGWGDPCELCPRQGTDDFALLCPMGFGYCRNLTGDFKDVNECLLNPSLCRNGRCINNDGSFRCVCKMGFKLDESGQKCIDENECDTPGVCGNGNCTNVEGSYRCTCPPGYTPGRLSPKCEDVNECRILRNICAFRCQNLPGSYRCTCPRGFELASDKKHCRDVNECTKGHDCRYQCKNFIGTYRCICPPGYRGDGKFCADINECSERRNLCANGRCRNIEGGFVCDCDAGYNRSSDGKTCQDARKGLCFADVKDGVCEAVTQKMMKVSKGECCCTAGEAWGLDCTLCPRRGTAEYRTLCVPSVEKVDNVCQMVPGLCRNGKCINIAGFGKYRCMCDVGFKLDPSGKRCLDVNECTQPNRVCQFTCSNIPGSFRCICPLGYSLKQDKRTCEDVDECLSGRHNCQYRCVNTVGSFRCDCPEGYVKSGMTCVDKDECMMSRDICGFGTCENIPGSYRCVCPDGYKFDENTKKCTGVDECSPARCQYGCQNLLGTYRCACPPGFVQDYYWNQCTDLNECSRGHVCGQARCRNTIGSFYCGCQSGFMLGPTGQTCQDVNECAIGGNPCSYGCQNKYGGFSCSCPPNFYPIGAGHCLSPFGEACYQCTLKGNLDGVPLVENNQTSSPDLPATGQPNGQANSGRVTWQAAESASRGRRQRRSVRGYKVRFSMFTKRNSSRDTPLLQLTPRLSHPNGTLDYVIARGNTSLFTLEQERGITSLYWKDPINREGTFYLKVKGLAPPTLEREEEAGRFSRRVRPSEKLALDIAIHVV